MNKNEYLERLAQQLSFYETNPQEILHNYSEIIDELLDEGLTMDEVISKLGRPAALAEDIAEEFDLHYTEQIQRQTTMPQWAKIALIIVGIFLLTPIILSVIGTVFGVAFGILGGILGILFGGIFSSVSIWSISGLTVGFKLIATITAIFGMISAIILAYFAFYGMIQLIQFIVREIKKYTNGGHR